MVSRSYGSFGRNVEAMKLDKILIIHPSRGRPKMAADYAGKLIRHRSAPLEFRYVFSLDADDSALPGYSQSLRECRFPHETVIGENRTAIGAVNRAAATLDNEDMVFNMSDDIDSSPGWDVRLARFVATIANPEYLVQPVDMYNGQNVPVIQMMSSALYRRLGYVLPPCYDTMYADNDLLESCRMLGSVFPCTGLGFEHLHPSAGRGSWDETYARENRPEYYASGQAMLELRRAQKYGLKL